MRRRKKRRGSRNDHDPQHTQGQVKKGEDAPGVAKRRVDVKPGLFLFDDLSYGDREEGVC